MQKGEWCGGNAEKQPRRILILGESHHWTREDWVLGEHETEAQAEERRKKKAAEYMTKNVVANYLRCFNAGIGDSDYRFFDKIVRSFGFDPNNYRNEFWSRVYFGNYVPVLCGVGDDKAKKLIYGKDESSDLPNRALYNNALLDFVNAHGIDVIFCFSRRVYNALPSYHDNTEKCEDTEAGRAGGKRDYISHCIYHEDVKHDNTDKKLRKELHVYGLRHPSGKCGFEPRNYCIYLAAFLSSYTKQG